MQLQRTEQWRLDRLGIPTASRYHDLMATGRAGQTLSGWKNYKAELLIERLTGQPLESFTSKEMQWGIDTEPLARLYYTLQSGNQVRETGFTRHETLATGASSDGLIAEDGGLEIKCPNPATHIETLHTQKVPRQYISQVQGNIWIYKRKWWDFVSFDPRMPENAKYVCIRVLRDDAYIEELEGRVKIFLRELDEEVEFINNYGKAKNEVQPRRTTASR